MNTRPPTHPRTARKRVPSTSTTGNPNSGVAGKRLPHAKHDMAQTPTHERVIMDGQDTSQKPARKKRTHEAAENYTGESDSPAKSLVASDPLTSPTPSKKRRIDANTSERTGPTRKQRDLVTKKKVVSHVPRYRSTERPIGTLIRREDLDRHYRESRTWWKISQEYAPPSGTLSLPYEGQITSYNLTQMSKSWIKTMVENLKQVSRVECSVRGWKETLLWSLGEANVADNGDSDLVDAIAVLEKEMKRGKLLDDAAGMRLEAVEARLREWRPRWYNEPLYELSIMRGVYGDLGHLIVRLTTTHGEYYVKSDSESEPWKHFWDWLE